METTATSLLGCLLAHCAQDEDAVFARFVQEEGEVVVSWAGLRDRAMRFAAALAARGVPPRETVFVLAPLGPDLLGAFLGAMLHGAVPALLSYPSSKVAPDVYAKNLRGVLELTKVQAVLSTRSLEEPLLAALGNAAAKTLCWMENAPAVTRAETEAFAAKVRGVPTDEVALLQHSSGSTGLQKGVALSHRAVLNQVRHYAKAIALDPERDRIASWLPLYHDMGLIATFLMPLVTGTQVIYMDPFRWVVEPAMLLAAIARHRATLSWLPNFAYVHMANRIPESRTAGLDLSSMRGFVNCSEPVREAAHRAFLDRFAPNGVREDMLWVSYAMAENTFAVTQAGGACPRRTDWIDAAVLASQRRAQPLEAGKGVPVVSCGLPIEGCEVRVVDEARHPVADRTIGEISLRSDSMLTEYHHNPEATAKALEGGFYFTGDLGYLAEGHVYITGRKKDLIIVGGRNFYPTDIEDVASEEAGVIPGRTAALGLENTGSGTEEIVVVAETEVADAAARTSLKRAIQRTVLERLDCAVTRVELVPRGWIIKTSSGKVARTANVEKHLAERAAQRASAASVTPELKPPVAPSAPEPDAPAEPISLMPQPESWGVLAAKVLLAALILILAVILRPNQALVLYRGF